MTPNLVQLHLAVVKLYRHSELFQWNKHMKLFSRFEDPRHVEQEVVAEDMRASHDGAERLSFHLSPTATWQVSGIIASGQNHTKLVELLQVADGKVQLTMHWDGLATPHPEPGPAPEHDHPVTTTDTDTQEEMAERGAMRRLSESWEQDSQIDSCPPLCIPGWVQETCGRKALQQDPVSRRRKGHSQDWSSMDEEDGDEDVSYSASPVIGQPIVSEEELTTLASISPPPHSRYSGPRLRSLIQNLQNRVDQQDLIKEFMALEHLRPADSCIVGQAPENREKNRYRDILPYDRTRVPVGQQRDYINASYIHMGVGPAEQLYYITAQGPLPNTQTCFWQMVWENHSDVIAMVTQEVERGRVKCHRYWPEKVGEPVDTGQYQLILDNSQQQDCFHIRIIRMVEKESGDIHLVRHLQFTAWPDHGTPRSCEQLLRFIRYMRAKHIRGPVTVHCSAGIGRTGVLICTDVILALIEKDLSINISSIVREMRLQRHGMVQTKEQYVFCYKVWLSILQSILSQHNVQWIQENSS